MYLISMGIYVIGAIMWTLLGTADVQPWDTYWIKDNDIGSGKYISITYKVTLSHVFKIFITLNDSSLFHFNIHRIR